MASCAAGVLPPTRRAHSALRLRGREAVLPHFRCSSRPGGSGQGLEVPRLCRFIRRPDHELAAGEEPAPNFLHFQPDHSSRTVPAAPKVRENRSVTLINPFEVPAGREDEALATWDRMAAYMRGRPGFLATRLHRAVAPGARFALVNVAEWASAEAFLGATAAEEFRELTRGSQERFPHHPGL